VNNSFTDVNPTLKTLGLKRYPMITTVDIAKFRQLCNNPTRFIASAIEIANREGYTGYNIDFEPNIAGTPTHKPSLIS